MLLALRMSGFFVKPLGSKREYANLLTMLWSGTPYCSAIEVSAPTVSMSPPIVLPSFCIWMNSSPGWPSSNMPTVM